MSWIASQARARESETNAGWFPVCTPFKLNFHAFDPFHWLVEYVTIRALSITSFLQPVGAQLLSVSRQGGVSSAVSSLLLKPGSICFPQFHVVGILDSSSAASLALLHDRSLADYSLPERTLTKVLTWPKSVEGRVAGPCPLAQNPERPGK